jgi:CheY-like chemotaxis protein
VDDFADRSQAAAWAPGPAVRQLAHDLNNSLTLIIGYSQLLSRGLADPQLRALVDEIEGAARRAADQTGQLLELSRPRDTAPVTDLGAEVASLQPVLGRLAGPRVSVSFVAPDRPVWVAMEPGEIEEIVMSLVGQAAPAAPAAGEEATLAVRVELGDQEAVLSLSGDGITADPGSGLSSVGDVVSQRGGRLDVEPAPGRGFTVRVSMPRHDVGPASGGSPGSAPDPSGAAGRATSPASPADRPVADQLESPAARTLATGPAGLADRPVADQLESPAARALATSPAWPADRTVDGRVLFVEDEPELRQLGRESLATIGLDVVAAGSAETALATLERDGPFDALVTDIVLPGRSGVQLARAARQAHPGLRVLYATGYSGTPDPTRTPAPGEPVLRKPYGPDDLRFRVAELLQEAVP